MIGGAALPLGDWCARIPLRWRVWAVLAATMVGVVATNHALLKFRTDMVFALLGALIALCGVMLLGTRLTFPLYYATTVGTSIMLPGLPLSVNRVAALLMLFSVVVELPWQRLRLRFSGPLFLLTTFSVYYLVVAAILRPPEATYPFESFVYIAFAAVLLLRGWETNWLRTLLMGFVLGNLVVILLPAVAEVVLRRDVLPTLAFGGPITRINGLASNAIFFAYIGIWVMPFSLALMLSSRSGWMWAFHGGHVMLCVALAILTQNRQTPIVMAAMLVVFLVLMRAPYKKLILMGVLAASLIAAPMVLGEIVERFSTTTSVQRDPSLMLRRDKVVVATEMIRDNLLFGIGHNYYRFRSGEYRPKGKLVIYQFIAARPAYIDMGYIQIMTEYGLVGAILFVLLVGSTVVYFMRVYWVSLRLEDPWHTNVLVAAFSTIVLMLVSCLIQDIFVTPRTYFSYALLLAAGGAILHEVERQTADRRSRMLAESTAP